jgi:hypothetical protein
VPAWERRTKLEITRKSKKLHTPGVIPRKKKQAIITDVVIYYHHHEEEQTDGKLEDWTD